MASVKRSRPTDFALADPLRPPAARRRHLLSSLYSQSFTHQTALQAHHSCVNALAISPGEGRWLASGGDDKRVLLWDATHEARDGTVGEPKAWFTGAQSNIFSIDFVCDGTKVFSAGNDTAVMCHDLETSAASTLPAFATTSASSPAGPTNIWLDNDDSIHGLSCHPSNPNLFLTAAADGTLRQYDSRTSPGCVGAIADTYEMADVRYHPISNDLFAYCGEEGRAGLIDGRMAWTDGSGTGGASWRAKVAREAAVVQYDTLLVRSKEPKTSSFPPTRASDVPEPITHGVDPQRARPGISSLAFAPSGSLLCLTLSGYLPTLYELSSPQPLATFSAPLPDPSPEPGLPRTYRNSCTTKHGSFGGGPGAVPGEGLFYAAGSDDFKSYVWEVPTVEMMKEKRRELKSGTPEEKDIGFASLQTPDLLTLPARLTSPSSILTGHRSIVNTALFHPTLPYLFTSGVEKVIIRHSASASPLSPSSTQLRSASRPPSTASWRFEPRAFAASYRHPSLFGPADPGLQTDLVPCETAAERERRLRSEDTEVLEYFDALIDMGECEAEELWARTGRGGSGSEDEDDDEGEEDEEERELLEAARAMGDQGITRRILETIYRLEDEEGTEGSSSEGGSGWSSEEEERDEAG
ncbi:hypothetical protein JCM1841_003186 [Sporobolomyces salmonicolor]